MPTAQRVGTVACLARLPDKAKLAIAHPIGTRAAMGTLTWAEVHIALDATPAGRAHALAASLVACTVYTAAASAVARK